jgi:hypothetical protein
MLEIINLKRKGLFWLMVLEVPIYYDGPHYFGACGKATQYGWRVWQTKSLTMKAREQKEIKRRLGSHYPLQGHTPSR